MDRDKSPTNKQFSKHMKTTSLPIKKPTSLSTLVMWNISKALEQNPTLNVKDAIKAAQTRLEQVSDCTSVQEILFDKPDERHLACALLAWQQLGHQDADSLCRFVETSTVSSREEIPSKLPSKTKLFDKGSSARNSRDFKIRNYGFTPDIFPISRESAVFRHEESIAPSLNSSAMGPVVMLPVETKIVMRLENTVRSGLKGATGAGGAGGGQAKRPKSPEVDTLNKIDQVCCFDRECADRLAALDATTTELRQRAGKLARREAERVELLERAEAAWKDLEVGFQRRLTLAVEKEEDIAKQISRMLEERMAYKDSCTKLSQELKDKTSKTEKERIRLNEIERIVCERACTRLKLSEETARGDAETAQQATRAMQLDRDLLFKQEQVRRNMVNLQSEVQSARVLTSEAERATRVELTALRDQMAEISNNLLDEDARNGKIKAELEGLCAEKMELIEDLEGCKAQCDGHMQGRMVELGKKREALSTLREKVMDCKCKVPVDESVEVKRTPSLAALCKCTPEDKLLESCSCTSMRSKLLSNLFSDLFGGLQSELTASVAQMPCQLLKCLEDNHNWDRSSAIKSHLKNYFSKLLSGELDIAIATSIENYHAKWVGISCADAVKMKPGSEDNTEYEGWEQRAVERRAQQLATELAEQLFQEREEELTKRAREIVESGPPPCECNIKAKMPEGCHCVKTEPSRPAPTPESVLPLAETPVYWHQAMQDVTQLKMQVEDLKKGEGPPEQDTNELVLVKAPKKSHAKSAVHAGKKGNGSVKTASANECHAFSGLGTCSPAVNAHDATALADAPVCWQQAMQDVTKLRLQVENLKKDSIKGEDLKKMQDQIARIAHRRSGTMATNYLKNKNENTGNEQFSKINRAVNNPQYYDMNKMTKEKNIKSKIKSHLIRGIKKPSKKSNTTYAVNMCLCSTKHHQHSKLNERIKLETNVWKQTFSKDAMSHISSTTKQAKPITNSFYSQDDSIKTYMSNEPYEHICPSNCVCFHKIPSNTSIDKLLETLAKWKGDLDSTLAFKSFRCDPKMTDTKSPVSHDGFVNFKSSTGLKSSRDSHDNKIDLCPSSAKCVVKNSAKSTEPMLTTDSVYMGAVNLDKSIEDIGKCAKQCHKSQYKCIVSNKCSCARILDASKIEGQINHVKKEKHKKLSVIKTKQKRRVKEIIVVDNMPQIKEKNKTPENEANIKVNQIYKEITNVHSVKPLDNQIKFLGVSLVDVNSSARNQISLASNSYDCYKNITKNVKGCPTDNTNINKKHEHCQESYSEKKCYPLPEFSKSTNSTSIKKHNNFINMEGQNDYSNCLTNNANKQIKTLNDDIVSTNFKQHSVMLSYMEESKNNGQSQVNTSYKNGNLDYIFFNGQYVTNEVCDIHKFVRCYRIINSNLRSQELEILKSTCIMTSEYFQQVNKTSNNQTEELNHKQDSPGNTMSTQINESIIPEPQLLPCECSIKLNDFKKFTDKNLATFAVNKDAAIDVQSSKCFKNRDESCVCCNKHNDDNCRDLEDNAFHLLEQYLKKKLSEFKAMSCSPLCIPPEEEEKIFSIIVQKVKCLISESTNQMICKCSLIEGKSQGSWTRAYGLLQEYLKIKIKKFQCSCLLAEDNKDYILPEVLEKISNLIEYDFQRLKKLCCCTNSPNSLIKTNIISTAENGEMKVSPKDLNALLSSKQNYSNFAKIDDQIAVNANLFSPINYLQQCMMPQLSITLTAEEKLCNTNISKSLHEDFSTCSLHKHKNRNSNSSVTNNELSKSSKLFYSQVTDKKINDAVFPHGQYKSQKTEFNALNGNEYDSNVKINSETIISKEGNDVKEKTSSDRFTEERYNISENQKAVRSADNYKETINHPTNDNTKHKYNLRLKKKTLSSTCNSNCDQRSTVLLEKKSFIENDTDSKPISLDETIDCICDDSLGAHVCPENIINTDPVVIDNIFTKSVPDTTFSKNLSYTFRNQLLQNIDPKATSEDVSKEVIMPGILKICGASNNFPVSEATCCKKVRKLVLKQSPMSNVVKSHAETNTFEDIASVDTYCSVTEDALEWCECNSQIVSNKQIDTDQLKRSIFFPSPVENNKNLNDDIINCGLTISRLPKHVCDCEKVPLCHVKLLVENIESKLANANCTCDSLIPKVCPVHSTMC